MVSPANEFEAPPELNDWCAFSCIIFKIILHYEELEKIDHFD